MSFFDKILRVRLLQHLAFWSISLYFLLRHFQASSELAPTDYIYTGIVAVFLVVAVYVNLLWLIPTYFQRNKYGFYLLFAVGSMVLMTYLEIILFDRIVDMLFPGYYLISYFDFWNTLIYFLIFMGITSLLHFSKSWFLYKESEARLAETQKEKIESELDALKNQINPHFLFNTLNSIYSLVLNKSEFAPEALIKLSDAMRYIIYESNHERVGLAKELEFISNYIELQRLRMSAKDTLEFSISGEVDQQRIAPLLLIPMIENCFKYGFKGETEASFVQISFDISSDLLKLHTENNIGKVDSSEREKPKGTGLKNLKQRLDLIYPDHHELHARALGATFIVDLQIDLQC